MLVKARSCKRSSLRLNWKKSTWKTSWNKTFSRPLPSLVPKSQLLNMMMMPKARGARPTLLPLFQSFVAMTRLINHLSWRKARVVYNHGVETLLKQWLLLRMTMIVRKKIMLVVEVMRILTIIKSHWKAWNDIMIKNKKRTTISLPTASSKPLCLILI